ncbi:protein kinase [Streptomyces sp. NPDC008086]|uniref:serine/threonine-protein kinase n=1 Tax=Streptomyces sp. NPDC008086 TaxID=3364807 RepID=UPI0036E6232E
MAALSTGDPESIGEYTLLGRLGSGGMGVVHLGVSASGRQVAVKVVHGSYAQEEEFRTRFRQEIAAARRVSGAFTAPVVDADPDAERPWMATLYVPGRSLAEVVKKDGPLGGRELRALGLGLAEALRDIHRVGLVHRDLKPANVLMTEDGPRVIDFGISRAADNQSLTVTGRVIGTPPFMSPEQLASPRDVTAASDVFSLGSLMVFAAVGAGPFDADSPYLTGYQVMYESPDLDGVPEALLRIVERCLDKDPAARPEPADLHRMFQALPDSDTVTPTPTATGTGGSTETGDALEAARPRQPRPPRPRPRPQPQSTATTPAGPRSRNGLRGRMPLTGLGVALAVVASVGVGLFVAGQDATTAARPTASDATTRAASLPAGWQPWSTALRSDVKGVPLDYQDPGCVADGNALFCGGTGFTAAGVDSASGRILWRFGTRPQGVRPIGVRDGLVYVYEDPDDSVRRVVALDAETGERRWQRDISKSQDAILYDGGLLTMSPDSSSSSPSSFVAYGASGQELWRAPSLDAHCSPSVLGGVPYALCSAGTEPGQAPVDLLKLGPGSLTETATLPRKAPALGAVGGRPLFLAPQTAKDVYDAGYERPYNALLLVDPATGKVRRIPLATALTGTATLVDGVVYFVRTNGSVTAVSADSGKQLWQKTTDMESLSAPAVSATYKRVYFANRFGRLLALDSRTGVEVWRTSALDDAGDKAQDTPPGVLLVKDAIVATAGDTAFSRSPDGPS